MRKRQPKVIGAAVRSYRARLGMTQLQVAEIADVAPETLSRIERNKLAASLDLATRLAAALDVTVDELLRAPREGRRAGLRPAEVKLLGLVRRLDEPQVEAIARALRILLEVGAIGGATPREGEEVGGRVKASE